MNTLVLGLSEKQINILIDEKNLRGTLK